MPVNGYFFHVVKSNGPALAGILATIAKSKTTPATVKITDNRPLKQLVLQDVAIRLRSGRAACIRR